MASLVITGADVTHSGNDAGPMAPMVEQIKEDLAQAPSEYYTAGGFSSIEDIEEVRAKGSLIPGAVQMRRE